MFKKQIVKKVVVLVLSFVIVMGTILVHAVYAGAAKVFEDVKDGYWAKNSIDYVSSLGYINGYGKTFGINDPITEGQYIAILCRMLGYENQDPLTSEEPARELGLLKDGEAFNSKGNLKRSDMAIYTIRAFELLNPDITYPDYLEAYKGMVMDYKELDQDLQPMVLKCVEQGLINGTADGTFNPDGESIRAQAAAIIHRILSPVEREKVKPVFATPDYEFETLVNDKEVMQDYLSTVRIDRVVDGRIIWSNQREEWGTSGDYGTSLLAVYNNKESNKAAYSLLKAMVYDAVKNKNYVVACYNDNKVAGKLVYFKSYSTKNGGVKEAQTYQYQITFPLEPRVYFDGEFTTHDYKTIPDLQKEKTMYEWDIGVLYDFDNVLQANSFEDLIPGVDKYKASLKNAFLSMYGAKSGTALYEYTMSEYIKDQTAIAKDQKYYNESITTIEGIEVHNMNGTSTGIYFGTGPSK